MANITYHLSCIARARYIQREYTE